MSKHIYSPDVARYELAAASKPIRKMFTDQVKFDGPDGCWEWQGFKTKSGYGRLNTGRRGGAVAAHRLALFFAGRPVHPERVVDHLCRNPGCVNPSHLDIVSQRINNIRGNGFPGRNARKTHCVHGHEYTPENTGWQIRGGIVRGRKCKACESAYRKRRYAVLKTA